MANEDKRVTIHEEDDDEQVGEMRSSNVTQTSSYLADAVAKLRQRMIDLWDKGTNMGYVRKYQSMAEIGRDQSCEASMLEPNRLKNRYANIMAYDAHRVKLDVVDDDPSTDYINASWVDGYDRPHQYIAAQGPVPLSFNDFWRMIWQYDIEIIAMVTNEIEGGKMKCHRYWPDPTSDPPTEKLLFGEIMVHHKASTVHANYIVREFVLEMNGEEKNCKQFSYTSWPDHGVPLTTSEMLGFRTTINNSITKPESPILIHCSAGVGRTGTYIAIDYLVKQALDMGGDLNVDKVVSSMRERRNYMVQTEIQYIFIHRAVLDALSELLAKESFKMKTLPRKKSRNAEEIAKEKQIEEVAIEAQRAREQQEKQDEEEITKLLHAAGGGADDHKEDTKRGGQESLGRETASASHAKAIIKLSIKDRMKLLNSAEARNLAEYKRSYQEWLEKNKVCRQRAEALTRDPS